MFCTVRQVSVYFEHPTLGMHLVPAAAAVRQAPDTNNNTGNGASAPRTYIAPAIVSSVQNTEVMTARLCVMCVFPSPFYPSPPHTHKHTQVCACVSVGDAVSRVNGSAVSELNFNGLISRIKFLPRPIIIHFVQLIQRPRARVSVPCGADGAPVEAAVRIVERDVDVDNTSTHAAAPAPVAVPVASSTTTPPPPVPVRETSASSCEPTVILKPLPAPAPTPAPAPAPAPAADVAAEPDVVDTAAAAAAAAPPADAEYHRPYRWQPTERPARSAAARPSGSSSSSSAGSSSAGAADADDEEGDGEDGGAPAASLSLSLTAGRQAELLEAMLGHVHIDAATPSTLSATATAAGAGTGAAGEKASAGGPAGGAAGDEVEEEAEV